MAVRLPIVLSQAAKSEDPRPTDDHILTVLFVERGWDATLVAPLRSIETAALTICAFQALWVPSLCWHGPISRRRFSNCNGWASRVAFFNRSIPSKLIQ